MKDNKSTLKIYARNLNSICIPKMYDNKPASVIWFRARSNCLMLNNRNGFSDGDTKCILCGVNKEDLINFILECIELSYERGNSIALQRPWTEHFDRIVVIFLF